MLLLYHKREKSQAQLNRHEFLCLEETARMSSGALANVVMTRIAGQWARQAS
jgi:hypothetical protein